MTVLFIVSPSLSCVSVSLFSQEHLVGLSNQGLESGAKPLLVKDQIKINRLEKQAEEFLSAVLYKKGRSLLMKN